MTPAEKTFLEAAERTMGRITALKRADLFAIRDTTGASIPGTVWTRCQSGVRGWYDLTSLGGDVADAKSEGNVLASLGMEQEKNGAVTLAGGKLMIVERGKGGAFQNPAPSKINDIFSEFVKAGRSEQQQADLSVAERFQDLDDLVALVSQGFGKSLIAYGGKGCGKSHNIFSRLKALGLQKNKHYFVVKGKITTSALYQNLFMHRQAGKLIVFDDTDSVWDNEDSANILKAALDSYDERVVSWYSNRTVNVALWDEEKRAELEDKIDEVLSGYIEAEQDEQLEDEDEDEGAATKEPEDQMDKLLAKMRKLRFPSEFKFEAGVIFISNWGVDDFDEAVLSRCFKTDMTLAPHQVFDYVEAHINTFGGSDLPVSKKREILQVLRDKHALGKLTQPNMRTFVAAVNIVKSGAKNWEKLLRYT